jgi:PIN domain nuclease of toxin-antitoxin system
MSAVLDTHAAIWYLLDTKNLSQQAFSLIDTAAASGVPTYISAVSLVEVVYLVERGRIVADAYQRFASATAVCKPPGSKLSGKPIRLRAIGDFGE